MPAWKSWTCRSPALLGQIRPVEGRIEVDEVGIQGEVLRPIEREVHVEGTYAS